MDRDEDFTVDEELFEDLVADESQIFKQEWRTENKKNKDDNNIFLERTPTKVVLNGYDVGFPFGKDAHKLELHAYLSLVPAFLAKKIPKEISDYVHPSNVYLHTFPFVLFKILKNIINTKEGLVFVDVSGEITDLFIVRNNSIEEISSTPKGENFFIRRIASAFDIEFDEAKTRLSQYQRNESNQTYAQKTSKVVREAAEEWSRSFKKLMDVTSKDKFLPQNLYFCGPATIAQLKEIHEQIDDKDFAQFTIYNQPFKTSFLIPESLKFHFDFKTGFKSNKDIFLLIEAIFASKFLR